MTKQVVVIDYNGDTDYIDSVLNGAGIKYTTLTLDETIEQIISEMKMKQFAEWVSTKGLFYSALQDCWLSNFESEKITTTELIEKFNLESL